MDALLVRCAVLSVAVASMGASYRTANFVVEAPTSEMARQIGDAAETYRRDLAIDWTGKKMPNWSQPCPIRAQVGEHLGAGGATSFVFEHGEVFGWTMTIQGSLVRILDSVLPHEVTHTVFATHFRQPLPRWADEGACTTVEHPSEKAKQQHMLIGFLQTNRGIAFSRMFAMREYPHDVMPLYSQGYSLARYLVAQGGKHKFLSYIADGLHDDDWTRATKKQYGYENLLALQNSWLDWVRQGSPALDVAPETPPLVAVNEPAPSAESAAAAPESTDAGPRPSADSFAGAGHRESVYDVAEGDNLGAESASAASDPAWRSRGATATLAEAGTASPAAQSADDPAAPVVQPRSLPPYQVTRPQDLQRPRQVILEWDRPPGNGSTTTASRPMPGPN